MIDKPSFWRSEKRSGLRLIISSDKLSGVWLDSRSVWHSVKCAQNGVPSETMCSQSSTGHLRSLNTVRDNNLRITSPALVPFKPWSSQARETTRAQPHCQCYSLFVALPSLHTSTTGWMKGTEVPNPRRSTVSWTIVSWRLLSSWYGTLFDINSFLTVCPRSSLTSFWRSFTGLVQLIFSFPSWFHTIWFYWSHTFHSFLSQITLCFSFGSKDMITAFTCLPSYRYSSFTPRAYLCWRHTYCQWLIIELAKNVSPKNKIAASHVVQIHTHARFPQSKKWPTYHVAVPTGNALASQRSIFRENRLKFRPSSAAEKVSIVCGTNNHVQSEMLSNRHTDTQTKYCNPRCACAPRVNYWLPNWMSLSYCPTTPTHVLFLTKEQINIWKTWNGAEEQKGLPLIVL